MSRTSDKGVVVKPRGNNVLIEYVSIGELERSTIGLPENSKIDDEWSLWRVVDVGEGRYLDNGTLIKIELKAGDEVAVHPDGIVRLTPERLYDKRKLAITSAGGVLCVVTRPPGKPALAN